MDNQKGQELIQKYLDGTATAEEKMLLNSWYNERSRTMTDEMPELDYEYWSAKISNQLPGGHKTISGWFKYSIAAAILIIAGAGFVFFKQYDKKINGITIAQSSHIRPGKKTATLTLANGKKITLSDAKNGELAEEAGISISKTKDGELVYEIEDSRSQANQMNTLTTAKGETYQVRLPDGSMVWLNAASSLIYPTSLNKGNIRKVELKGEGYFEIAKDKKRPFIVKTAQQEVTVLGTHFNISAYAEEKKTLTTLVEGSVKVSSTKDYKVLVPNQQSSTTGSDFSVETVEADEVIAWKNGLFIFNDESLESIMREISRWYDVEVVFDDVNKDKLLFGGVSRHDDILKVLKKIELTGGIHFKIEGRRIIIEK